MREILFYFGGMVIAFLFITIRAYHTFKKSYIILPTVKNIWAVIDSAEELSMYVCAILFYPIALLYCGFLVVMNIFDFMIKTFSRLFTPNLKIIEGKIALLKVGDNVKFTRENRLGVDQITTRTIIEIRDDAIILEMPRVSSDIMFIRKENFVLYNNDIVGIAEIAST
jgi:hypothetical protein